MMHFLVTDPTKGLPATFFTPDRLEIFWYYVKYFTKQVQPLFFLCLALFLAAVVCVVVMSIFYRGKDDDDDDYETYYY
ncbi:hypothetical protein D1872_152820 [compost metagenome]